MFLTLDYNMMDRHCCIKMGVSSFYIRAFKLFTQYLKNVLVRINLVKLYCVLTIPYQTYSIPI